MSDKEQGMNGKGVYEVRLLVENARDDWGADDVRRAVVETVFRPGSQLQTRVLAARRGFYVEPEGTAHRAGFESGWRQGAISMRERCTKSALDGTPVSVTPFPDPPEDDS